MSRKLLLTTLLLGSTVAAASVFGGEFTTLVEKIPSMFVTNDDAHAVPVRDLNDPGRHAFVFDQDETFQDGELTHVIQFTVPEGKRLVLEAVSMRAFLPDEQTLVAASVQIRVNQQNLFHQLPTSSGGKNPGGLLHSLVSEARTLYADGKTEVFLRTQRSADEGAGPISASVSGHLIDCQAGVCE